MIVSKKSTLLCNSMGDLNNLEYRNVLLDTHPVVTKKYRVNTLAIEKAYEIIRLRIWRRRPGCMHAHPRWGKTECAEAVLELAKFEFPKTYFCFLSADSEYGPGGRAFMCDLLSTMGIGALKGWGPKLITAKALVHIESEVLVRHGSQFVLFIDEMQWLSFREYQKLAVIHNRLKRRGISMTTLGFAQPQINSIRSGMAATGDQNLIARFLDEPISFEGCLDAEGLRKILGAYDETKHFPQDSGWSFTRFFLPNAFDAGFRLTLFTDLIWKCLTEATKKYGLGSIPMETVTRTIEDILLASRSRDASDFLLDVSDVEDSVAASNVDRFEYQSENPHK